MDAHSQRNSEWNADKIFLICSQIVDSCTTLSHRMYELQHDEGRYFLHEHSKRIAVSVEEIQEMTGAKLMSVSRGTIPAKMITVLTRYRPIVLELI